MKKLDKEALLEGIKEIVRTAIIAVAPVLIVQIQGKDGVDWKVVGVALSIAVLRGLDKLAHEKGVESPLDLKSLDKLV